jgi:hypothetical protein
MSNPSEKVNQLLAANLMEQLERPSNPKAKLPLGFHMVRLIRKLLQSNENYEAWLLEQQTRVIRSFVAQCKKESAKTDIFKPHHSGVVALDGAELDPRSIEMLRQQKTGILRPRIPDAEQLHDWLLVNQQRKANITNTKLSLWQKILSWCNPFDQANTSSRDCLAVIHNSGLALRIELMGIIEAYHLICKEHWADQPPEYILEQGLVLFDLINKMNKLVASAEDIVIHSKSLQAGFDLSILLKISEGLSNEKAMITYLVAHPKAQKGLESWDQAIEVLRGAR